MDIKNVQGINLGQLPNGNHYQLNEQTIAIIKGEEGMKQSLDRWMPTYEAAFKEEDAALKKITFSELTRDIAEWDDKRDEFFRVFERIWKAYLNFPEDDKRLAAVKIGRYTNNYNIKVDAQYDRETGMLTNLIQDLHRYCEAELELLGLTNIIAQLEEANQKVNELLLVRNEEYVDNKHIAVQQARINTDEAYRLVITAINALAFLAAGTEDEGKYDRLIALLNQNIERIKQQVFKKTGQTGVDGGATENPDSPSPTPPEGGEDTPSEGEQNPNPSNPNPENPNPETPGNGEGGENNGSNNGENGDNNGTTTAPDDPWYNPDDEPD